MDVTSRSYQWPQHGVYKTESDIVTMSSMSTIQVFYRRQDRRHILFAETEVHTLNAIIRLYGMREQKNNTDRYHTGSEVLLYVVKVSIVFLNRH